MKLTDEDLGRIAHEAYMKNRPAGVVVGWDAELEVIRAARIAQGIAVRDAVAAEWAEERDDLRRRLADAEKERDIERRLSYERGEALMSELKTTTTRPVAVRFDCTAEEAWDVLNDDAGRTGHEDAQALLDYLSTRAVLAAPVDLSNHVQWEVCEDGICIRGKGVITPFAMCSSRAEAKGIVDNHNALYRDLSRALNSAPVDPKLCEEAPVDPPATAETLEQLAKIAYDAVWGTDEGEESAFYGASHDVKDAYIAAVTAILNAAGTYVDLKPGQVVRCGDSVLHAEHAHLVNSRIRFRVAAPQEPDEVAPRDDLREHQRERYHEVYMALVRQGIDGAHKYAVKAAAAYPRHLAELDAALEETR